MTANKKRINHNKTWFLTKRNTEAEVLIYLPKIWLVAWRFFYYRQQL